MPRAQYEFVKVRDSKEEFKEILNSHEADNVKVIAKNKAWTIYKINTPEASLKYGLVIGGKANWSISGADYEISPTKETLSEELNYYFNKYLSNKNDSLYFVISNDGSNNEKYAILEKSNILYFWDRENDKIDDLPDNVPPIPGYEYGRFFNYNDDKIRECTYDLVEKYEENKLEQNCILYKDIEKELKANNIPITNFTINRVADIIKKYGYTAYKNLEEYYHSPDYRDYLYELATWNFDENEISKEKIKKLKEIISNYAIEYFNNSSINNLINIFNDITIERVKSIEGMNVEEIKKYINKNKPKKYDVNYDELLVYIEFPSEYRERISFKTFIEKFKNALVVSLTGINKDYLFVNVYMSKEEIVDEIIKYSIEDFDYQYEDFVNRLSGNEEKDFIENLMNKISLLK